MNKNGIDHILTTLHSGQKITTTTHDIIATWGGDESKYEPWQKDAITLLRGRTGDEFANPNSDYWKYLIENLSSLLGRNERYPYSADPGSEILIHPTMSLFEKAARIWGIATRIQDRKDTVHSLSQH